MKTYGPHKDFGYKDFIPVAEHHDGFQMYESELSKWNAKQMGPQKDVSGELTKAFSEEKLVNGASSHRVEHWFFMGNGQEFDSDIKEPMQRGDFYWPAKEECGSEGRRNNTKRRSGHSIRNRCMVSRKRGSNLRF